MDTTNNTWSRGMAASWKNAESTAPFPRKRSPGNKKEGGAEAPPSCGELLLRTVRAIAHALLDLRRGRTRARGLGSVRAARADLNRVAGAVQRPEGERIRARSARASDASVIRRAGGEEGGQRLPVHRP